MLYTKSSHKSYRTRPKLHRDRVRYVSGETRKGGGYTIKMLPCMRYEISAMMHCEGMKMYTLGQH